VLLHNARIVLPLRVEQADLVIEDGRIARIIHPLIAEPPKSETAIDLTGLTVFPGFIDIHIHGTVGVDAMTADAEGLLRISEYLGRQGITGWLPTLVPASASEYEQALRAIGEAVAQASACDETSKSNKTDHRLKSVPHGRILGVHYEGPFVNSEQCGALHREHFRTFRTVDDLASLPTIENGAVHMMTVAPEIEGGIDLISELRRRGWIVSIGHTRATLDVLDQARAAGAQHMTHFMNAMAPLHHRAPGPIGWGLLNDDVTVDLIADGVHIDRTMLKVLLRCVTPARMALISDAIAAAGMGDGEYEIWGEKIAVKDGRTQNARGSIAGSVITMLDAVRMMLALGASESDVARMASLNPARLMGIDHDCGSIEVGKRADLVALDRQSEVQLTIVGGEVFDERV
jgi:N-acetylglucosamine-6-phosphate deacetylase